MNVPGAARLGPSEYSYYVGSCSDPNRENAIKQNYLTYIDMIFMFCQSTPDDCDLNTVKLYCGNETLTHV